MDLIRASFLTGTTWFAWKDPCHMTPLWLRSVRDGTRRLVLLRLAFWTFGRRRLQKGSSETSCGSAIWGRWKGGSDPSSRLWRKCRINMLPSSGHGTAGTSTFYLRWKPPEPGWNCNKKNGVSEELFKNEIGWAVTLAEQRQEKSRVESTAKVQ